MVCIVTEEKKHLESNCSYHRIHVRGILPYVVPCTWLSVNNYSFPVLLSKRITWKFSKTSHRVNIILVKKTSALLNTFKELELHTTRHTRLSALWKKRHAEFFGKYFGAPR